MAFLCSICNDQIDLNSDIRVTPCGHVYHFECITEWISRSSTCPQCRKSATRASIQKLYFNLCDDDTIGFLEKAVSDASSQNEMLKKANKKLKDDLKAAKAKTKRKLTVSATKIAKLDAKVQCFEAKDTLNTLLSNLLTLPATLVSRLDTVLNTGNRRFMVSEMQAHLRSSEKRCYIMNKAYFHLQRLHKQLEIECSQSKKKLNETYSANLKLIGEKTLLEDSLETLDSQVNLEKKVLTRAEPGVDGDSSQIEPSSDGSMPLTQSSGNANGLADRNELEENKPSPSKKRRLATATATSTSSGPS